ncbi:hypothetical protein [Candidatus Mycobacterium methanotrophicum]|uniref:Uncharacterized protein n=1 Tax=Candidatus Mycobacterium methanotrophicum TaxID=2943498 RepID=A0ABY4QJQ9_9MYCO|nr:hypothetical protein [Candidatus Mycobacterium methanotrophicum]UQX10774.1 hypothetical protein M5I08_22845 [Candidatus Mycobacterium methanotrophicum]
MVGNHSGYNALGLEGWTFGMRWPDGVVRDTGLWLDPAGCGKPRLRSMLYVRFTSLADLVDPMSMTRLGADGERIPDEWLPVDPKVRPSPKYLKRLYADLGVTFKADV